MTTLVVWCLKLLCFNSRKHCRHVSNLSDVKISVLTPEDYSQCSISSSPASIAIYLHAMIVPLLHENLHNRSFSDLQRKHHYFNSKKQLLNKLLTKLHMFQFDYHHHYNIS